MKKILFLFLFVFTQLIHAQEFRQRIRDEEYPSSQVKKMIISSTDTEYIINPSPDTLCHLSISARAGNPKKMEEFQKVMKVVSDLSNENLRIETFTNHGKGEFLVEIAVPKGIELDFSVQNSKMKITGTNNSIHLTHHSKDILLKDIIGGNINIQTKNGNLQLQNCSGDFQLNTNKGIEAEIVGGSLQSVSGGHQKIVLKNPIPVTANTQNGDIRVQIPQNSNYDCRINADVSVKLDMNQILFEGSISQKSVTGKLNQGITPFRLTANKGSVWLQNFK